MRPLLFFPIIIALYLIAPYFVYQYYSFQSLKDDNVKIEAGIVNTNQAMGIDQQSEKDVIEQEGNNIMLQSYGYLGGALFTILCPTLLLIFRHKILR